MQILKKNKNVVSIINGNINVLGWVVLKSDILVRYKYDLVLAKLNIIESEDYWQRLVNTDNQRSVLFPDNYHELRFGNENIPFHMLQSKKLNDYDVVLKHLNEQYGLLNVNYKLYHSNLLRNDKYIEYCQNNHRDFDIGQSKNNLKK